MPGQEILHPGGQMKDKYLSPCQHKRNLDFITIVDRFLEFFRVSTFQVEVNFDQGVQLSVLMIQNFLHIRKAADQIVEAFPDGPAHDFDGFSVAGVLTMAGMYVDLDAHAAILKKGSSSLNVTWNITYYKKIMKDCKKERFHVHTRTGGKTTGI